MYSVENRCPRPHSTCNLKPRSQPQPLAIHICSLLRLEAEILPARRDRSRLIGTQLFTCSKFT